LPQLAINVFNLTRLIFTFRSNHSRIFISAYFCVSGSQVAYPGVGPVMPGEEPVYHSYYQWVPFVLFFQVSETRNYYIRYLRNAHAAVNFKACNFNSRDCRAAIITT
jgi:hypothetical protein